MTLNQNPTQELSKGRGPPSKALLITLIIPFDIDLTGGSRLQFSDENQFRQILVIISPERDQGFLISSGVDKRLTGKGGFEAELVGYDTGTMNRMWHLTQRGNGGKEGQKGGLNGAHDDG